MGTLHLVVNVRFLIQGSARGQGACSAGLLPFFYFLTLAPCDYVTYYQARELAVGVWPPRHGPHHQRWPSPQIKACTALLGMHRKTLYSTKYDTLLVTLSLQTI